MNQAKAVALVGTAVLGSAIAAAGCATAATGTGTSTAATATAVTAATDVFGLATDLPVVASSGTGAYRGISGGFAVTLTGDEVQARPCATAAIAWQVLVIAGSGRVADLRCVRVEQGDRLAAPPPAIGRLAAGAAAAGVQRVAVH